MAYLYDIYPTLCKLTGTSLPKTIEGKSLVPVIKGEREEVRDYVFRAYLGVQRMVRDERWKLIFYPQAVRTQLFDLKSDPHELTNLLEEWR